MWRCRRRCRRRRTCEVCRRTSSFDARPPLSDASSSDAGRGGGKSGPRLTGDQGARAAEPCDVLVRAVLGVRWGGRGWGPPLVRSGGRLSWVRVHLCCWDLWSWAGPVCFGVRPCVVCVRCFVRGAGSMGSDATASRVETLTRVHRGGMDCRLTTVQSVVARVSSKKSKK